MMPRALSARAMRGSLVVLDGEVAAAPLRLVRGADGEAVRRRGEPGLLQQPRQIGRLRQ